MTAAIIFHPLATFLAGAVIACLGIILLLSSCAAPNNSAEDVTQYRQTLNGIQPSGLVPGSEAEKSAIETFKAFLQGIGNANYVRENTSKAYATDAYLDDTLVVHRGAAEIEKYFLKTSAAMKSYQVTIEDVSRSGDNYYIRWEMIFSAPALSGGKLVHSVGISHVRFSPDGKVAMHKDFWDSGKNFYGHLPVVGGAIGFVRKRLEKD